MLSMRCNKCTQKRKQTRNWKKQNYFATRFNGFNMSCDQIIKHTRIQHYYRYQLRCHCDWKGKRNVFRFDWLKNSVWYTTIPFYWNTWIKRIHLICDVRCVCVRHFYLCHMSTWNQHESTIMAHVKSPQTHSFWSQCEQENHQHTCRSLAYGNYALNSFAI